LCRYVKQTLKVTDYALAGNRSLQQGGDFGDQTGDSIVEEIVARGRRQAVGDDRYGCRTSIAATLSSYRTDCQISMARTMPPGSRRAAGDRRYANLLGFRAK
jgi:hypothetical protein